MCLCRNLVYCACTVPSVRKISWMVFYHFPLSPMHCYICTLSEDYTLQLTLSSFSHHLHCLPLQWHSIVTHTCNWNFSTSCICVPVIDIKYALLHLHLDNFISHVLNFFWELVTNLSFLLLVAMIFNTRHYTSNHRNIEITLYNAGILVQWVSC